MANKKYTNADLERAKEVMDAIATKPKDEQNTAVALVNAFIAGMEAQKLASAKSA